MLTAITLSSEAGYLKSAQDLVSAEAASASRLAWSATSPGVDSAPIQDALLDYLQVTVADEWNGDRAARGTDAPTMQAIAVLERLVDHFEDELPEPFRLRISAENAAYAERIVHGTVGFRLRVTRLEAKEKMSQDKPAEVVDRVTTALDAPGPYSNPALAERMRRVHASMRPETPQ